MDELKLNIYGFFIQIKSVDQEVLKKLKKDFNYFVVKEETKVEKTLSIKIQDHEEHLIPRNLKATKQTSNSIYFDKGNKRYNDYYGKATTIFNYKTETVDVYFKNKSFLHEITYLLILSRSAKFMDSVGLHKIHACSVKLNKKNIVFMMGSKGGKSTLFLELIRTSDIKIISDDTPVVDRFGNIRPFPLRIGIEDKNKIFSYFPYLRDEDTYEFKREYYSKKYLVPINALKNEVSVGLKTALIQGVRTTRDKPLLKKISRLEMFKFLIGHMIVGVGLPIILEYFIEHNLKDHLRNTKNLFSRIKTAILLLVKSETYIYYMSDNVVLNGTYLKDFFDE